MTAPLPPATDVDRADRATVDDEALDRHDEKVVVAGADREARPGGGCGAVDLDLQNGVDTLADGLRVRRTTPAE